MPSTPRYSFQSCSPGAYTTRTSSPSAYAQTSTSPEPPHASRSTQTQSPQFPCPAPTPDEMPQTQPGRHSPQDRLSLRPNQLRLHFLRAPGPSTESPDTRKTPGKN